MGVSGRPKRTARVPARLSDTENVSPTRRKNTNQQSNNGLRSPSGVLKTHNMSQSSTSSSMESLKEPLTGKKLGGDSVVVKSTEAVKSVGIPPARPAKRGKAREVAEPEPGSPPVKKKPSASNRVDEEVVESADEERPQISPAEEEETASKAKKTTRAASGSSPSKKKTQAPKGKSTEKVEEEVKVVEPARRNRALKKVSDEGDKVPIARGTRSFSRKSSQEVKEAEEPKKKQVAKKGALSADSELVEELVSEDENSGKVSIKKKQIAKKGAPSLHSGKGEEFVSDMDENSEKIPKKRQSTKKPVLKAANSNKLPSTTHKETEEVEQPAVTEKKQSDKAVKGAPKAGKPNDPKEATSSKKQMTKKGAKKVDSDLIEDIISEEDEKTEKVVEKKQSTKRAQKASPKKSLSTDIVDEKKQSNRKPVLKTAPKAAPNKKFLSTKSQVEEMFPESSDEEADEEGKEEVNNKTAQKRSAVVDKTAPKKLESVKKPKGAAAKDTTKELDADSDSLREETVKKAAPSRLTKKLDIDQVISQLDSESGQEEEEKVAEPSISKRSSRSTVQQPPKPAETGYESAASSTTSRSTRRSARSPVLKSSTKRIPAAQPKVTEPKVAEPTFPRRSNRPTLQQPSKTVETDQESTSSSIFQAKHVAEPASRRSSRPSTVQQPSKSIPAKSKPIKEVAKPTSRRPSRSKTVQQPSKPTESDEDLSNLIEEVAEPTPTRRYSRPRVQQPDEDGSESSSATPGRVLKQKKLTDYTAKKSPTKRTSLVVEEKRIPIWKKVEPKPEPVSSKADDIYELEFSDSEAKPAKKKRKRAPRKPKIVKVVEPEVRPEVLDTVKPHPVQKPKENTHRNKPELDRPVAPKQVEKKKVDVAPPVRPKGSQNATLPASGKDKEDASQPTTPPPTIEDDSTSAGPSEKKNTGGVTPLLMNVAKKLERYSSNQEDKRMESMSFLDSVEEEIPSPPPQLGGDTDRSIFFGGGAENMPESPVISDHSTNPVARLSGPPPMDTSTLTRPVPLDIDNCFGFEELPVESTPMKNQASASIFVSPILKNPVRKPARLDPSEASKLMRLAPSVPTQPAKKQTKLTDYDSTNKPVQVDEEPDSGKKKAVDIPPSPPSAFTEPPRRSYSRRSLVVAKRAMFQDDSEHSEPEDDVEEVAAGPSKRKKKKSAGGKKKVTASSKRDAKMIEWEKLMASHFKDVEEFDLSQ